MGNPFLIFILRDGDGVLHGAFLLVLGRPFFIKILEFFLQVPGRPGICAGHPPEQIQIKGVSGQWITRHGFASVLPAVPALIVPWVVVFLNRRDNFPRRKMLSAKLALPEAVSVSVPGAGIGHGPETAAPASRAFETGFRGNVLFRLAHAVGAPSSAPVWPPVGVMVKPGILNRADVSLSFRARMPSTSSTVIKGRCSRTDCASM